MHTTLVVIGGLILLGTCVLVAWLLRGVGGLGLGALSFLPLWVVATAANMYVGVRSGHSVAEEIPFLILVFVIPAAAAAVVFWL
jgi:hypothetical protein